MSELKVSDIPKVVLAELATLEKEHGADNFKIALVMIASAISEDITDKTRLFEEALDILRGQLVAEEEFMPITGMFFLQVTEPQDDNSMEITRQTKRWQSGDPVARKDMMNRGEVLVIKEIDEEGNEIEKIVADFIGGWKFDENTNVIKFDLARFVETEADLPVFIDKRVNDRWGRENKWRVNRPLRHIWKSTVHAVIGIDTGSGVVQYPAQISLSGAAADPSNTANLLSLYASRSLKFYKRAKARVEAKSKDGKVFYLSAKDLVVVDEVNPTIENIEKTMLALEKYDILNTADLSGWCSKYADKNSDQKDYKRYFYITAMLNRIQTSQYGTQLMFSDKYTPKGYYISAAIPDGTTLEDFGIIPGAKVQIVGRAYMKKSTYNYDTRSKDERPWPHILIGGAKTYIDTKSAAMQDALAFLGMGGTKLTDDGE